jgi:hypothetical protein
VDAARDDHPPVTTAQLARKGIATAQLMPGRAAERYQPREGTPTGLHENVVTATSDEVVTLGDDSPKQIQ